MTQNNTHTSSSREDILARIRSGLPQAVDHPSVPIFPVAGDPVENFKTHLTAFSGKFMEFATRAEALAWLNDEVMKPDKTVFSSLPDFAGTVRHGDFPDPHKAHIVDTAVCSGEFGVGETGSVFVTDTSLGLAAAALFSTDLYLLLDRRKILPSIQEAYGVADIAAHQYGAFYSGPSATADIEAVHITGAQAELSLTVLIYDNDSDKKGI